MKDSVSSEYSNRMFKKMLVWWTVNDLEPRASIISLYFLVTWPSDYFYKTDKTIPFLVMNQMHQ